MKTYRRHNCTSTHRDARSFIRCAIKPLARVRGFGEYALVSWCGFPSATLWHTPAEAQEALDVLNGTGCGSKCTDRHEVIRLDRGPGADSLAPITTRRPA